MQSTQLIHQTRLTEWATIIAEQKNSGLSIKNWCSDHNISIHKYNYWKHLLKEQYVDQLIPEIIPISLPDTYSNDNSNISTTNSTNCTNVNLSINGLDISINSTVPEEFLTTLIKAVRNA